MSYMVSIMAWMVKQLAIKEDKMAKIKINIEQGIFYECPACGNNVELGQYYCQDCGEPLEWVEE